LLISKCVSLLSCVKNAAVPFKEKAWRSKIFDEFLEKKYMYIVIMEWKGMVGPKKSTQGEVGSSTEGAV